MEPEIVCDNLTVPKNINNEKPLIVGIAGASGSGKSTLVDAIYSSVGSQHLSVLHHDMYYKGLDMYDHGNHELIDWDHPDSLDTELLIEHIKELKCGNSITMPKYDFTTSMRVVGDGVHVEPHRVIVVEGILVFAIKKLRELFDVSIFVDVDLDIAFIRRLKRDVLERGRSLDHVCDQYQKTVRNAFLSFVEPSKRYADVIVPRGGYNSEAISMVTSYLRARIPSSTPAPVLMSESE
ncbi:hypothetical protein PCE1_000264 [Barthelona sp. PCE]